MSKQSVGIFDSGVGGLSCAAPFAKLMPGENIIYFGDTKNAPYGVRPLEEVQQLALSIADFLCAQDVKLLAIACNTITVAALDKIRKAHPEIPVLGTIEPASKAAVKEGGNIGVIATPLTIESGAYEKEIKKLDPYAKVFSLACPKLVPLIEAGHVNDALIEEIVSEYLDEFVSRYMIDTLILGCTHFPLIDKLIKRLYPGIVTISSSGELAKAAAEYLSKEVQSASPAEYLFYASRLDQNFEKMAAFACPGLKYKTMQHVL